MSEFSKNLTALLIRSFLPMNSFYFNYLVDSKKFTSFEVSNHIAPFYFYASFFGVFICKSTLHSLGLATSSVIISGFFLLNMILLLNLPIRHFFLSKLIFFISGFANSFDIILRFYIAETNNKSEAVDYRYSYLNALRAILISFSCFVGQKIAMISGHHEINIHICILSQFIGFCISLFNAFNSEQDVNFVDLNSFNSLINMNSAMCRAFFVGCIANCFGFYIKFFSQSIFRDSKEANIKNKECNETHTKNNTESIDHLVLEKPNHTIDSFSKNDTKIFTDQTSESINLINEQNSSNTDQNTMNKKLNFSNKIKSFTMKAINLPVFLVAIAFIKTYQFILPKYKNQGNAQKEFLNGHVDAFNNLLCNIFSYGIVAFSRNEYKEYLYSFLLLIASINLFLMSKMRNRKFLCVFYISICICTTTSNQISKNFLKKNRNDNNLVVASFISEIIVHSIVNQACKILKVNSLFKSLIYSIIGFLISFLAISTIIAQKLN